MATKNRGKNAHEGVSHPKWVKKARSFVVTIVKGNDQKQEWFPTKEEAETYRDQKTRQDMV